MKKTIKIIATFIALIIVNCNMCFADVIVTPRKSDYVYLIAILLLMLIFFLGIILLIIEVVAYIRKKKKLEDTNKIKNIINKTNIFLAIFGSLFVSLYLIFDEENFWGIILLIGSIMAITTRNKKHIKLSNIVCAIIIILSTISFLPIIRDRLPAKEYVGKPIQNFNTKFTQYEGDNVRGSNVNTMLQTVVENNKTQDEKTHQVEVYFSDNCKDKSGNNIQNIEKTSTSAPKVPTGRTYKVTCNISNKGLVQSISVECNEEN